MDTNRYILLQPNSKIPTGNHWQYVDKDGASDHLAAGGNIALATGERSGLFVLDVDVKNGAGGQETLDRVQEVYGLLPPTRMVSTPSGGAHFYRSEEHTSELESLMRISYAVFCLKKKKDTEYNNNTYNNPHTQHLIAITT